MFRSAASGVVKRVQSTPFIIRADKPDYWQEILMGADFGSWDRYLAKTITNYLFHDVGAWTELIAPGDPLLAPTGPIVGIAALDSMRVYPTGNATYPAIYYDDYGEMHLMHHTRVVPLIDNEYSEEYLAGYGECAQTRALTTIRREILLNQYIEGYLDDKPRPGIRLWSNVDEVVTEAAFKKMEMDKKTDDRGTWGSVVDIFGLDASEEAKLVEHSNVKAPEGFDFDKYKNEIALEMAAALGLDVQDFWQLTQSGGLGTGTQSEILAQKSRGKTFGNLLKRITRMLNEAFPRDVEYSWEYRDPQEDQEEADKAQAWANTITILSPYLQPDEIRQLASNQIGPLKDVLLDADGNLRRLNDEDPEPIPTAADDLTAGGKISVSELLENVVNRKPIQEERFLTEADLQAFTQRSFTGTGIDFSKYFRSFSRVGQAHSFPTAIMRATFREELYNAGTKAYNDGLNEGGVKPEDLDELGQAERNRKVAEWLALQSEYVNKLVDEISGGDYSKELARSRSELWVSKSLRTIFYTGLHDAAGQKRFQWRLGATEEHCKTCLQLNGQVHRLKDYLKAGLYPGSHDLECKGFNCDCKFVETDARPTGRLPGGRTGPFARFADRLGGFLRGLVGR
jgi:hypothetical protein